MISAPYCILTVICICPFISETETHIPDDYIVRIHNSGIITDAYAVTRFMLSGDGNVSVTDAQLRLDIDYAFHI